jgi:RNA polymerase sigma factor (sigma-70 family)
MRAGTDGELVAASRTGDRTAFATLIDRHGPRLRAVAARMLDDRHEAEDVAQEALLRAHLGLDELREPDRFGGWVCGIAVNLAKMRLRARRDGRLDDLSGGRPAPVALDGAASPEQAAETMDVLRRVLGALDLLPPRQRDVALLHYVEGLSCEEIAALTGQAPGTVRVRLHRARRRLQERLAGLVPMRKEVEEMIEVTLEDVVVRVVAEDADAEVPRLANQRMRIVVLKEVDGDRVLPIWIGASEGDALALQLGGGQMPRPLTADLTARLLEATGARIERVAVSSLRDNTFYAVVTLDVAGQSHEVDARPSDAFNLAARVGAPIFVDNEVMAQSCVTAADDLLGSLEREHAELTADEEAGVWRTLSPELLKALYPPPPTKK